MFDKKRILCIFKILTGKRLLLKIHQNLFEE